MSRSGRTADLLTDWRLHPPGCTAEHGWKDGYDGPCTDDAHSIAEQVIQIDMAFNYDHIERLRAAFDRLTLEEFDHLMSTPQGRKVLDALPRRPKKET